MAEEGEKKSEYRNDDEHAPKNFPVSGKWKRVAFSDIDMRDQFGHWLSWLAENPKYRRPVLEDVHEDLGGRRRYFFRNRLTTQIAVPILLPDAKLDGATTAFSMLADTVEELETCGVETYDRVQPDKMGKITMHVHAQQKAGEWIVVDSKTVGAVKRAAEVTPKGNVASIDKSTLDLIWGCMAAAVGDDEIPQLIVAMVIDAEPNNRVKRVSKMRTASKNFFDHVQDRS